VQFPRYRSSGDSPSPDPSDVCSLCSSRYDKFFVQKNAHFAAEHIEQNNDAIAVTHALDQAQTIGEDAVADAYLVVKREFRSAIQFDKALGVLAAFQVFNYRLIQCGGEVAITYQAHDAYGGVNRPPSMDRRIETHEQVRWVKRGGDRVGPARVPAPLHIKRQVRFETLPGEVHLRLSFGVQMDLNNMPG